MAMNRPNIIMIGCGPGAAGFVTPAAREAVRKAQAVLGAKRLLELFPESRSKQTVLPSAVDSALTAIDLYSATETVAVLVSGDPGLFSLAKAVIARFGRDRCKVVPAVSSLQVAFARLGLDWSDVRIISAHGRVPTIPVDDMRHSDKIVIFTGSQALDEWTIQAVEVMSWTHRLFVCENLTLADEAVREMPTEEFRATSLAPLALLVLVRREDEEDSNRER